VYEYDEPLMNRKIAPTNTAGGVLLPAVYNFPPGVPANFTARGFNIL
jgi:hypothetical protein